MPSKSSGSKASTEQKRAIASSVRPICLSARPRLTRASRALSAASGSNQSRSVWFSHHSGPSTRSATSRARSYNTIAFSGVGASDPRRLYASTQSGDSASACFASSIRAAPLTSQPCKARSYAGSIGVSAGSSGHNSSNSGGKESSLNASVPKPPSNGPTISGGEESAYAGGGAATTRGSLPRQQRLYFLPLSQWQGSLRPILA